MNGSEADANLCILGLEEGQRYQFNEHRDQPAEIDTCTL